MEAGITETRRERPPRLCTGAALLFVLGAAWLCPPAAAQTVNYHTGQELRGKLRLPAGVSWSGVPLRDALEMLGRDQRTAVMLDRRVDPSRPVNFSLRTESLEQLLQEFAAHGNIEMSLVDSVVYFGPPETARVLATVAAMRRREAERLPQEAALRFSRTRAWSWPMLATPRALAQELADEARADIVNLDQLPHDLWPAANLPPLGLADRLTLLLAGFGMTFRYSPDGAQLQLTPMPQTAAISQTYPGKGQPRENAEILQRLLGDAEVTVQGDTILVSGPWEAHEKVAILMQGGRVARTVETPQKRSNRTVYTLKVENEPVGGVIKALAQQLKMEVKVDPAAEDKLTTLVSFNVADVSRQELFRAVLHPAGLACRITENEVQIFPAK